MIPSKSARKALARELSLGAASNGSRPLKRAVPLVVALALALLCWWSLAKDDVGSTSNSPAVAAPRSDSGVELTAPRDREELARSQDDSPAVREERAPSALPPGSRAVLPVLSGVVLSKEDGAPIEGSQVTLWTLVARRDRPLPVQTPVASTRAGRDGTFSLAWKGGAGEGLLVSATAPGGEATTVEVSRDDTYVEIRLDASLRTVRLELEFVAPGVDLPPHASLWIASNDTRVRANSSAVDIDGTSVTHQFLAPDVPGIEVTVQVTLEGLGQYRSGPWSVGPGEAPVVEATVHVEDPLRLAGRVVDAETGAGLPGVYLRVAAAGSLRSEARAGDDGRFELLWRRGHAVEGRLSASAEGYVPVELDLTEAVPPNGATPLPIEVKLDRGCRLEGVVITASGPVDTEGVRVVATWPFRGPSADGDTASIRRHDRRSAPDAAGWFELDALPPGQVLVQAERRSPEGAWARATPPIAVTLTAGEVPRVELDLDADRDELRGRIEVTGTPPGFGRTAFWVSVHAVRSDWTPYSSPGELGRELGWVATTQGGEWTLSLERGAANGRTVALRVATSEKDYIERVLVLPAGRSELELSIPLRELVEFAPEPPDLSDVAIPSEAKERIVRDWHALRASPPTLRAVTR